MKKAFKVRFLKKFRAQLRFAPFRLFTSKKIGWQLISFVGILLLAGIYLYAANMPRKIEPRAYNTLLEVIAKGESRGNYNAHFGNAKNAEIQFTQMSVGDVMKWQEQHVKNGQPSSAVGKYQIIRPTLSRLVNEMKISPDAKFNEELQDRMAIKLLERRGSLDYVNDKISREQFAANIAKEWAALPKIKGPNPNDSYYAGDGLNRSLINQEEVFKALEQLKI